MVNEGGDWQGAECDAMNFRAQDVIESASSAAMMGASAFDDTLAAALMTVCPQGNCAGVIDISPVLMGQMTPEELAMLYGSALLE